MMKHPLDIPTGTVGRVGRAVRPGIPLTSILASHRRLVVVGAALLAGAWRLAFLTRPLAPDEGGLLVLARQWQPGSSLYGDYFVDRPPALVAVVALADALGGEMALRGVAVLAVVASVLVADRLGRVATGEEVGGTAAAVAVAVYLSLPTSGVLDVNAEMLACPVVLGGLVLVLESVGLVDSNPRRAALVAAAAGAAGALAAGLKQNLTDVLVVGAVAALCLAWTGRRRAAALVAGSLAAGALLVTVAVTAAAAARGTGPGALWDALVTFRLEAARVIGDSAPGSTGERAEVMLGSLLLSGMVVLVVGGWIAARRRGVAARPEVPVRWLLLPLLVLEVSGLVLGGSYWLHYLLLLTPSLAWCAALMATHAQARAVLAVTLAWATLLAGTSIAAAAEQPLIHPTDRAVIDYLQRHAEPGDTATVAFGRPNILAETGMSSPYPQLWSLPARVLDPRLEQLRRVLRSPQRPTWVVTMGENLTTWGVEAGPANRVLARNYVVAGRVEGATIYRRSGIVGP